METEHSIVELIKRRRSDEEAPPSTLPKYVFLVRKDAAHPAHIKQSVWLHPGDTVLDALAQTNTPNGYTVSGMEHEDDLYAVAKNQSEIMVVPCL